MCCVLIVVAFSQNPSEYYSQGDKKCLLRMCELNAMGARRIYARGCRICLSHALAHDWRTSQYKNTIILATVDPHPTHASTSASSDFGVISEAIRAVGSEYLNSLAPINPCTKQKAAE
eukprot:6175567-Pleurochrysis_carterae.AAC.1